MQRPPGVTAAAIVCILGSVLVLFFSALLLAGTAVQSVAPEMQQLRGLLYLFAAVLGLLGILGIVTGVGLLRLRPWARQSILVIAGVTAAFTLTGVLAVAFVPLPADQPGLDPALVRRVVMVVYGVPFLVSLWWLLQFTRPSAKAAFHGEGQDAPPGRPLMIGIIGWFNVVGGVLSIGAALAGADAMIAGILLRGWSAALYYVFVGGVTTFLGWRLLQLDERARVLTIWWFAINIVHLGYIAIDPGVRARIQEIQRTLGAGSGPDPFGNSTGFTIAMSVFTAVLLAAAIWPLVTSKSSFSYEPPDSPAS